MVFVSKVIHIVLFNNLIYIFSSSNSRGCGFVYKLQKRLQYKVLAAYILWNSLNPLS